MKEREEDLRVWRIDRADLRMIDARIVGKRRVRIVSGGERAAVEEIAIDVA